MKKKSKTRQKEVPEIKLKRVKELVELIKNSKTIMLVSIKGIPGGQFQKIKNMLKENAKIRVLRKSLTLRALEEAKLEKLQKYVHEDIALLFSNMDAFELAAILSENQTPVNAKTGQVVDEDIVIEAGATDLPPGPAISELSAAGLKVKIEDGKIAIQERKVITRKGEKINNDAANVMVKLNIMPFKVGFIPEIAYDSEENKIYENIKIDKKKTLEELKEIYNRALGFAIKVGYICKETISFLIRKAENEKKALEKFINIQEEEKKVETKTEKASDEKKEDEQLENKTQNKQQEETSQK